MKKHYDIGIVGCWYWGNYGSLLNGYATYKILKSFGLSPLNIVTPYNGFESHAKKFFEAVYTEEDISPVYPFEKVHEYNDICDMFLTGSDQIWHFNAHKENTNFAEYFRLNFADESKKKISFATSFGRYQKEPENVYEIFKKLYCRYDAISVREQEGVDILRNNYGINSTQVLEPVLDVPKEIWCELAEHSEYNEKAPYLLTYILDPTPEKRAAIEFYSKKLGVKAINILDGFSGVYKKNKETLNLPNTLPNIWCADLLKYYMNAEYVITDSFHGVCFSLIFNKTFIAIGNYGRGIKRFESLLNKTGLSERLIPDPKVIPHDISYLEKIDFSKANKVIAEERENSVTWLKNAIEVPKNKLKDIRVPIPKSSVTVQLEKSACMGCGACVSICPKQALVLSPDDYGYYRSTIDYDKCIDCGLCAKICPAMNLPYNDNYTNPKCYELVAKDKAVVYASSSGGAFTIIAKEVFRREGVIFGAAWNNHNMTVEHIMIEKESDLHKLQKSKYLQSYMGDTFRKVKDKLQNNVFVLFVGCPCQVAGLKSYLGNKLYDNLILVDILCTYAPSAMFFQKYINDSFEKKIKSYQFRYKEGDNCWNCVTVAALQEDDKKIVRKGVLEDEYQRVFHDHTMCSIHCENCKYQASQRFGDLTLGDFWGISKKDTEIDASKGVSCVIINNHKGKEFFEILPKEDIAVKKERPLDWIGGNGMTQNGHNYSSKYRDDFYKVIKFMPFSKAVNYAIKPNHGRKTQEYDIDKLNPLQYASNTLHFKFDPNIWEEHYAFSSTVLSVKEGEAKLGRFATLPLNSNLKRNTTYIFSIKFKIKSESKAINFHIEDSGSHKYQVIHSYKKPENYHSEWVELSVEFVPKSDVFDEFMIGAAQLNGNGNYLAIDYINIYEK